MSTAAAGDRGHLVHLAGAMGGILRQVLPEMGGVGAIINTSSDVDGADAVASLAELCAALGVTVVVVVGGERLAAALRRALKAGATPAATAATAATAAGAPVAPGDVTVVAVPKSGGVVSRGAAARRKALAARVREYFYGTAGKLCPFTVVADWADVTFVRVGGARRLPDSLLPAGEASTLERVGVREVDLAMGAGGGVVHAVCGVSQASTLGEVLSKPVWGWVHVAKVDAEKRTVTLLAPSPGRPPARYLLVGGIKWLE